jgi:hypothetical protein
MVSLTADIGLKFLLGTKLLWIEHSEAVRRNLAVLAALTGLPSRLTMQTMAPIRGEGGQVDAASRAGVRSPQT